MENNYNTKNQFLPDYEISENSILDKYLPSKQTLKKTAITGLALLTIATAGASLSGCVAVDHNPNTAIYDNGTGGGEGGGAGGGAGGGSGGTI
jgi:hypothetical protein